MDAIPYSTVFFLGAMQHRPERFSSLDEGSPEGGSTRLPFSHEFGYDAPWKYQKHSSIKIRFEERANRTVIDFRISNGGSSFENIHQIWRAGAHFRCGSIERLRDRIVAELAGAGHQQRANALCGQAGRNRARQIR
ncbi:hypothetical protein [Paraburkholderia sp. ZP32-5]|uniref:hypothetical protein n=1 Tax=Paraburkholderia sp. ZP32-5 TaxID=2883245 RepID=UPI001F22D27A|nr:hypothetical protein [Paraburkholderia sp. ZP32-5]